MTVRSIYRTYSTFVLSILLVLALVGITSVGVVRVSSAVQNPVASTTISEENFLDAETAGGPWTTGWCNADRPAIRNSTVEGSR